MNKFFMHDMKDYHSSDAAIMFKMVCIVFVVVVSLSVICAKMDEDKLSHLSEQKSRFTQCAGGDYED